MGSGITSGECQAQDATNISEEEVSQWLYTSADTVIITVILPMLLCLGVTTNVTFLFVLFRVPKMRSDTSIYLMHLGLADLLYLTLAVTHHLWRYGCCSSLVALQDPFVNSAECVSFFTVVNTGYFASLALVTMVSFEKYLAFCHPIKHLKIRGKQRTYRLVAICWLAGLIFSVSMVPRVAILNVHCLQWPDSDKYQGFPSMIAYCGAVQPWVQDYTNLLLNFPWLIAMVANIYMYVRIIQVLNKSGKISKTDRNHKSKRIQTQVGKMLIVNGIVFFICQTPYRVISLSDWICSSAQIPNPISAGLGRAVWWVSNIPQFLNTIVNPLIYGAIYSQYRAAFIQAFLCKAPSRKEGPVKPPFALQVRENSKPSTQTVTKTDNDETEL